MELTSIDIRDADTISRGIKLFAQRANGGLVVPATPLSTVHLATVIASAAQNKLPAIYPYRYFVDRGGLISYGADNLAIWQCLLRGSNSQGSKSGRPTRSNTDEVRADHKSQDRQDAWPRSVPGVTRPCRCGD